MRISDWSSDVCSSDLPNGSFADVASAGFVAQISGKLLGSDPLDRIAESLHRTMVAAVTRMTSGLSPTTLDKALTDWSHHFAFRSEERRVGKECVRPCRSRWAPYH